MNRTQNKLGLFWGFFWQTKPLTLTFTYPFRWIDSLSIDGAGIEGLLPPGLPIRLPILSVMKENFLSEEPSWSQFGASAVLTLLFEKRNMFIFKGQGYPKGQVISKANFLNSSKRSWKSSIPHPTYLYFHSDSGCWNSFGNCFWYLIVGNMSIVLNFYQQRPFFA